ncbi:MAG: HAMP domain-containing protein [Comamonadaceae bacterium]|nr:HAMP domain-containing protein [Comamonadaceae bacterium]
MPGDAPNVERPGRARGDNGHGADAPGGDASSGFQAMQRPGADTRSPCGSTSPPGLFAAVLSAAVVAAVAMGVQGARQPEPRLPRLPERAGGEPARAGGAQRDGRLSAARQLGLPAAAPGALVPAAAPAPEDADVPLAERPPAMPTPAELTECVTPVRCWTPERRRIVGFESPADDAVERPIVVDGLTVGWVALTPFESASYGAEKRFADAQTRTGWLVGGGAVLLAAAVALWASRRVLRPVHQVAEATHRLAAGQYGTRVAERADDDEIGRPARDFNQLALTLQRNEAMRREFMADVSHELRTPLGVLNGELEALEDGVAPARRRGAALLEGRGRDAAPACRGPVRPVARRRRGAVVPQGRPRPARPPRRHRRGLRRAAARQRPGAGAAVAERAAAGLRRRRTAAPAVREPVREQLPLHRPRRGPAPAGTARGPADADRPARQRPRRARGPDATAVRALLPRRGLAQPRQRWCGAGTPRSASASCRRTRAASRPGHRRWAGCGCAWNCRPWLRRPRRPPCRWTPVRRACSSSRTSPNSRRCWPTTCVPLATRPSASPTAVPRCRPGPSAATTWCCWT